MKIVVAIAAAFSVAAASAAQAPNLRASSSPDIAVEDGDEDGFNGHCVRPGWRNCFFQNGNENNVKECCPGSVCKYVGPGNPYHKSGGSNNPANFVCEETEDNRQRPADDTDRGRGRSWPAPAPAPDPVPTGSCIRAGHGNFSMENANESGTPCCEGSRCVYFAMRGGGENNPANFVCLSHDVPASFLAEE